MDKKLAESIAQNKKQVGVDLANDPTVKKRLAALQKTTQRMGSKKYKDRVLLKAMSWAIEIMGMEKKRHSVLSGMVPLKRQVTAKAYGMTKPIEH
jgi:hypothetical protein